MKFPLRMTLVTLTLLALTLVASNSIAQPSKNSKPTPTQFNEWTVAQLQAAMTNGSLTSEKLTKYYIQRIIDLDQNGPGVTSIPVTRCRPVQARLRW